MAGQRAMVEQLERRALLSAASIAGTNFTLFPQADGTDLPSDFSMHFDAGAHGSFVAYNLTVLDHLPDGLAGKYRASKVTQNAVTAIEADLTWPSYPAEAAHLELIYVTPASGTYHLNYNDISGPGFDEGSFTASRPLSGVSGHKPSPSPLAGLSLSAVESGPAISSKRGSIVISVINPTGTTQAGKLVASLLATDANRATLKLATKSAAVKIGRSGSKVFKLTFKYPPPGTYHLSVSIADSTNDGCSVTTGQPGEALLVSPAIRHRTAVRLH